jgi:hypothetical protein
MRKFARQLMTRLFYLGRKNCSYKMGYSKIVKCVPGWMDEKMDIKDVLRIA